MTRRELVKNSVLLAPLINSGVLGDLVAKSRDKKLHIGACDWSLGKDSDIGAFDIAKEIGLEGIQVNLCSLGNNLHLRDKSVQDNYLKASARTGISIASLAIGELNNVPYKSDSRTDQWVSDSIDVAKQLKAKVILLAFFYKNDLRNDEKGKMEVVRKLKMIAPKAEKEGIILGIESYLSAKEHQDIIQRVGSKNVKVFYDFRNSADAGHDVMEEIKWLGKDAICELHIKENGFLFGKGTMDWQKIFDTLIGMGYYGDGWIQIEWSSPKGSEIVESYKHNLQFLKNYLHNY